MRVFVIILFLGLYGIVGAASVAFAAGGFDTTTGPLPIGAGGSTAMWVWPSGNVGVGIGEGVEPKAKLEVKGGVKIGTDAAQTAAPNSCTSAKKGTLSYTNGTLYHCNGSTWASVPAQ